MSPSVKVSIVIPSLKLISDNNDFLESIKRTVEYPNIQIFATHTNQSAAKNRNECLAAATGDIIIQVDDDIRGFFPGWDRVLIQPLIDDLKVGLISAELIYPHQSQSTLSGYKDIGRIEIQGACLAHRKTDIRYDEKYIGSGYEDNDFCLQHKAKNPFTYTYVNYDCKLVHLGEKKNRTDENWLQNQNYFLAKWHNIGGVRRVSR